MKDTEKGQQAGHVWGCGSSDYLVMLLRAKTLVRLVRDQQASLKIDLSDD